MYLRTVLSLLVLLSPSAFSQGLSDLKRDFQNQVAQATPFLEDAMNKMKYDYLHNRESLVNTDYWATHSYTSGNASEESNPIATITTGVVKAYTNWTAAGADNERHFALEVTFKTAAQKPGISPLLEGKTVLFIPHGPGPQNLFNTIKATAADTASNQLTDPNNMGSIAGYQCFVKWKRCTAATSGACDTGAEEAIVANQTSTTTAAQPGIYSNGEGVVTNLWTTVSGPFSLCGNKQAVTNSLALAEAAV